MISPLDKQINKYRVLVCLLIIANMISGCSGSSESIANDGQAGSVSISDTTDTTVTGNQPSNRPANNTTNNDSGTLDGESDLLNPSFSTTTLVSFDITVPAYMSNQLNVRLDWGNVSVSAAWVRDENWTTSEMLPVNTENPLTITFADRDGSLILGQVENTFRTGNGASESVRITADQFDTDSWDNDNDGVSNLDESILGTNPVGGDVPVPVQAVLELVPDKTFRITWQTAVNASSYRVLENPDGISGYNDISGELPANSVKYEHRVALYNRANARYVVQACNANGCADSNEQIVSGSLERAIGYIKASDPGWDSEFGTALSLSADGNTLAVGSEAKVVYVFARVNSNWQEQARLVSPDSRFNSEFGKAVSLSADGNTLAVGAHGGYGPITNDGVGATYVYSRTEGNWNQQAHIQSSNAQFGDQFGFALSLSSDGEVLAVGAPQEASAATGINGNQNDNTAINSGAVYVFVLEEGVWRQQAYLKASSTNRFRNEFFGHAVSINGNGTTLAVGAPRTNDVHVFTRISGVWNQQAYLQGDNTETGDGFGTAVSISRTGDVLAVGAPGEKSAAIGINGNQNDNSAVDAGAAYVFAHATNGWQQEAYLKASNTDLRDEFGYALSLSADGDKLVVGAYFEQSVAAGINGNQNDNSFTSTSASNDSSSGAAYTFLRSDGSWQQQAYIKSSNTGNVREDTCWRFIGNDVVFESGDKFGSSVSLSADGNTLAVGAPDECGGVAGINGDQDDNSIPDSGAVYLY